MYTLIFILNTDKFGKSSTLLPYACCPLSFKVHLLNFYNDNDISLLEYLLSMIYDSNLMAVSLTPYSKHSPYLLVYLRFEPSHFPL